MHAYAELMTNTPMQALTLMNDPTYVEAARVLAERTMQRITAGVQPTGPLFMFRLATSRDPSEARKTDNRRSRGPRYRSIPRRTREGAQA